MQQMLLLPESGYLNVPEFRFFSPVYLDLVHYVLSSLTIATKRMLLIDTGRAAEFLL